MRIDSNQGGQAVLENTRTDSAASSGSSAPGIVSGRDQAELSGTPALVEALAAQASQLPDVREAKVVPLRQAVQSGNYQASPEKVANALLSHLLAARST